MSDTELFMEDAADAKASLRAPWTVERHNDEDEGYITYEIWCQKPYWRICTIPEDDNPGAKAAAELIVRDHNAALARNAPLPWDAHANRRYEPVETRAKKIYEGFIYDGPGAFKPPWVEHGNGTKQDEARELAREELRAASHSPIMEGK